MSTHDPLALDLTPDLLLRAYRHGIFPMAESADSPDLMWIDPPLRGILPLDGFKLSRSLRKKMMRNQFEIRIDSQFEAVIDACALEGADREETWINPTIRDLYGQLFARGFCHTVEVWQTGPDGHDELVGGLYGLAIGRAFFGESMFHRVTDTSKIALAALVARLQIGKFTLLDTQFLTPHLETLGGIEITRGQYQEQLQESLQEAPDTQGAGLAGPKVADFYQFAGGGTSEVCLQLTSQTS